MSLPRSLRTLSHVLALAALGASASLASEVRGSVRTLDGRPAPQAVVRPASVTLSSEEVTGPEGRFRFDLPDGS